MPKYDLDHFGRQIDLFKHLFERWIKQAGLSYNTYAVLYTLSTAPEGAATQKDISHEWLIAKQTVFNVCKDFHEKGWIVFSESPHDKRERLMSLTGAGRAQAAPMLALWQDLDARTFAAFGQRRAAEMFAMLEEFARVFEAEIDTQAESSGRPSENTA